MNPCRNPPPPPPPVIKTCEWGPWDENTVQDRRWWPIVDQQRCSRRVGVSKYRDVSTKEYAPVTMHANLWGPSIEWPISINRPLADTLRVAASRRFNSINDLLLKGFLENGCLWPLTTCHDCFLGHYKCPFSWKPFYYKECYLFARLWKWKWKCSCYSLVPYPKSKYTIIIISAGSCLWDKRGGVVIKTLR